MNRRKITIAGGQTVVEARSGYFFRMETSTGNQGQVFLTVFGVEAVCDAGREFGADNAERFRSLTFRNVELTPVTIQYAYGEDPLVSESSVDISPASINALNPPGVSYAVQGDVINNAEQTITGVTYFQIKNDGDASLTVNGAEVKPRESWGLPNLGRTADDWGDLVVSAIGTSARYVVASCSCILFMLSAMTGMAQTTGWGVTYPFRQLDFQRMTQAPAHREGRIYYNTNTHSFEMFNDHTDVSLSVNEEIVVRVVNHDSGSTLTNGRPVTIVGRHGLRPNAVAADWLDGHAWDLIGLATENIADNAEGYVTTFGMVNGINTSGLTEGGTVYLGDSPGTLTNGASQGRPIVGVCVVAHNANGKIFVAPRCSVKAEDIASGPLSVSTANVAGLLTVDNMRFTVPRWVDSLCPGNSMGPGSSAPVLTAMPGTTRIRVYGFNTGDDATYELQAPHGLAKTNATFLNFHAYSHIHISPSSLVSGTNAAFIMEYALAPVFGNLTNSAISARGFLTNWCSFTNINDHILLSFGAITNNVWSGADSLAGPVNIYCLSNTTGGRILVHWNDWHFPCEAYGSTTQSGGD